MTEEFRPVKGFERYYVSDLGRVLNTETGKFLKMTQKENKYLVVNLCKNGKIRMFKVHRLVAQAFIPNPENLETVDHLDGNKLNNRVDNLRWLSRHDNASRFWEEQATKEWKKQKKESMNDVIKIASVANSKPIVCLETGRIYESIKQASEELNLHHSNIVQVLKGKYKHTKGFHFEYLLKE